MTSGDRRRTDVLWAALRDAGDWLAKHYPDGPKVCLCGKALPCPAEARIMSYAQHLMTRIDYYGTEDLTILMPVVQR